MKKILSIVLSLIMVMSVFAVVPLSVLAEETDASEVGASSGTTGDCTWTLDDNGVLTISGNGKMENYSWFEGTPWRPNLTEVILDVTEVIIEDGVTNIGGYAFQRCDKLTSITIPDSVTSIGHFAFVDCDSLKSVTIPDSVTSIDVHAFANCDELMSVTIPDSVTSIGAGAFDYCDKLTSITIPDSVTSIGNDAFSDTAWYDNLPDGLVYAGKVAYEYKGECPSEVVIKDGTKGIAGGAFFECTGLTSVTIPDSVTSIGTEAFYGCTGLMSVTIPDSVTSIDYEAFGYYTDDDWNKCKVDGFTIYGYDGTAAQKYAEENEFKFVSLGEKPQPQHKKGDADGDGEITVTDATRIQQYLAHIIDETKINLDAAKTTGDDLSVIDATRIQQHLAKLINLEA